MRIAHVAPHYYPSVGGAQSHLRAVSEGLARRGHEVLVVTVQSGFAGHPPASFVRDEVVGGVRVHRLRHDRVTPALIERAVRWPGIYRLARATLGDLVMDDLGMWSAGVRAHHAIRHFHPDVVGVVNWYFVGMVAALAVERYPRFARIGMPHFHTEDAWSRRPGYGDLIRRYDAVLVNTEHERRFVETLAPDGPRLSVTGVGVDPTTSAHRDGAGFRARLGLGDAPLVGFLGRLDPSKGVVALIEAMPIVWRTNPAARLLLAGPAREGTRAYTAITEALSRLSVSARRHITHVEQLDERDKASYFDALDIFAMPSIAESFGIAYLEAWLCRKPVIGANLGSTPFVIRDGVDGILVDPHDPGSVARAIVQLLADSTRRARMGQGGYERTIGERTWDHVTQAIEGAYTDILEARRRQWRS